MCIAVLLQVMCYMYQELPGGYGRVKPDIVTYGSSVRGSALQYVLHSWLLISSKILNKLCEHRESLEVFEL